jgi:HK97 family phage major capsid protein
MNELDRTVAEQRSLLAKRGPSNSDTTEIIKLQGKIDSLRELSRELHDSEQDELREAAGRAVPVTTGQGFSESASEWRDYVRTGDARSLSTGDTGAYVIPNAELATLTETVRKSDPILNLATRFDMRGGNSTLELPVKATHGVVAVAGETAARPELAAPTFSQSLITCLDYYTTQITTQLWVDSTPRSEELMLRWIVDDIFEQFGVDLAVGDGIGNPLGLFAATSYFDVKQSGVADSIASTNFVTLYTALAPKFRAGAVWLMNSTTLSVAMGMDDPNTSATTPLVTFDGAGVPRILGKPVMETSSAPSIGNGAHPIAFADVASAYAVGEHFGPSVLVDHLTVTPYIRFYGLGRLGAAPWNPDACVLLKSDDS